MWIEPQDEEKITLEIGDKLEFFTRELVKKTLG